MLRILTLRLLPSIPKPHPMAMKKDQPLFCGNIEPQERTFKSTASTPSFHTPRHLIGEELVVYPAIIASLSEGQEAADRNRLEHQGIKEKLKIFQDLASTDPRFVPTLRGLMDDFGIHARHEEDVELPRLESMLSKDESVEMTKSLDRTKVFVPSRSHPHSPVKPPFESVAGLITAPIDSVADVFRKWPDGKKG
ncbi:unnamed protein product [Penicillium salamii]|nr:unnamed protein product [Penicillium salamii]CAG8386303.1 unnamed protein product [Penicillium salamii]